MDEDEQQHVPARLWTFDAADWPGVWAWAAARRAYALAHGWPDTPLSRMLVEADVRRGLDR